MGELRRRDIVILTDVVICIDSLHMYTVNLEIFMLDLTWCDSCYSDMREIKSIIKIFSR